MALKLFKLAIDATADITTTVKPEISQYFYEFDEEDVENDVLTIPAASFVDDTGAAATELATVTTDNGYHRLFINGVLQQFGLYTADEDEVTVNIGAGVTISENAPITLIVVNFDPESDSDIVITT
jgi:hypothetical protein